MALLESARLTTVGLVTLVLGVGLAADKRSYAPDIEYQLGDLLFAEARYGEAADAFERARDSAEGGLQIKAGVGLVRALLRTADFRRAKNEAAALVQLAPESAEAVALQGDAMWAGGLFEEAEGRYRDAASLDPAAPRPLNGIAKSLAARNQLDGALDAATTAVAQAPNEGEFYHTLGYVYERQRRYAESASALSSFVNLLPNKDHSDKALWTRQQIRFLQSFGDRVPIAMAETARAGSHQVPFRIVRDKIVVKARINNSRTMDFVLDTGAEMTVIAKPTAERLRIDPIVYTLSAGVGQVGLRGLQVGRLDSIEVSTLKVENVPVLIKNPPLKGLPTQEVESFSPLALGLSLQIDYGKRMLTMTRELPLEEGAVELPLRLHRLATVRGLVNGNSAVQFVVDTGGEVISISRATYAQINAKPPRHIPLKVYGTSGWDPEAFLMPGLKLAFDTVKMDNLSVVVLNLDAPSALLGFELGGIVGHRFLSKYRVGMDLQRSVLILKPIAAS